jgi:hypothetical protein
VFDWKTGHRNDTIAAENYYQRIGARRDDLPAGAGFFSTGSSGKARLQQVALTERQRQQSRIYRT